MEGETCKRYVETKAKFTEALRVYNVRSTPGFGTSVLQFRLDEMFIKACSVWYFEVQQISLVSFEKFQVNLEDKLH